MPIIKRVSLTLFICLVAHLAYAANHSPQVGIITPSSGQASPNQAVLFTTSYIDTDGWQNILYVYLIINTSNNGKNAFYGYYDQNSNKLFLRNDANTVWLGGFAPGASNSIENSYAKIDCSQTQVSGSATTLTVKWSIAFKPAFSPKTCNSYLYVKDDKNSNSGWKKKGAFTIDNPPQINNLQPSSGRSLPNQANNFTTTYFDLDGYKHIQGVYLLINTSTLTTNCVYLYYNQNDNKLYLRDDQNRNWQGGYNPGANRIIQNSYCQLDCSKTTVSALGNTLTINWNITFKSAFLGNKNIYLSGRDDLNIFQDWIQKGEWGIRAEITPPTGSIKINNDDTYTNISTVTLNLSSQDNSGGSGLDKMQFSNDGSNWSTPEPYAESKSWTVSSGDGEKTVSVKFSDKAGNWSTAYLDTIILDTTAPQITGLIPANQARFYAGETINILLQLQDSDLSPLEYQFSVDSVVTQAWSNQVAYTWTAILGKHTLKVAVRDIGGQDTEEVEVFVYRKPISPPLE